MNITFLYDDGNADGSKGGAELTMEEFASAAPSSVAFEDLPDADVVVVGNCVQFGPEIIPSLEGRRVVRYHHDLARHEHPDLREWLDENAEHVFTSPLHRERYGVTWDHGEREAHIIPPAINLDRFRLNREQRRKLKRSGIITLAAWQNPGKGGWLVSEVLRRDGLAADCFGTGQFRPMGENVTHYGEVEPDALPGLLHQYETFLFLPVSPEPFGRCVVEAWAAGCEIVTNDLVGSRWFIENDPAALDSAADDFWGLICG